MAEFDISFKIAAHSSGREMCWLRSIRPEVWEPISETVQTTERLADRAFRAEQNGQRFVVYFEAYTEWRQKLRWNILAKSGMLSEREELPTRTFLFLLTPIGYHEQGGTFRLAVDDEATQQLWFREICLWQEKPEPWWEQVPGLMALLPLCDHGRSEEDAVRFAAERIKAEVEDSNDSANLLTSLGFFSRLAAPHIDAFGLIGRESMSESTFYQEIMAEGAAEEMGRAHLGCANGPFWFSVQPLNSEEMLKRHLRSQIGYANCFGRRSNVGPSLVFAGQYEGDKRTAIKAQAKDSAEMDRLCRASSGIGKRF